MTQQKQAITGVNSSSEVEIRSRYPSLAGTVVGRIIGGICDSIPRKVWGIKISHMLFALPTAPLAAALYLQQKARGEKYVLTNHSIRRCSSFGDREIQTMDLTEIDDIAVSQQDGQGFYHAADLHLIDGKGDIAMRLDGIPNADIFRLSILKARDARTETAQALATIDARQTA
jgi:hypothetical protein